MTATVHRFPEPDPAGRADVLSGLRRARRDLAEALQASDPRDPSELQRQALDLARWAEALDDAPGDVTARAPVLVVRACAEALSSSLRGPPSDADTSRRHDVREALDRALAAVMEVLEHPQHGVLSATAASTAAPPDPSIAVLFPLYRSLRHLAGAARVHPVELWSGAVASGDLPADARVPQRPCDAAAVADLEAALLRSLRQPDPPAFERLSDLCAALGAAVTGPAATVWRLASAVFEAQGHRLLEPDVYLKRLGSQLLTLARTAAAESVTPVVVSATGQEERLSALTHELWFFGVHAAPVPPGVHAPRLMALRDALRIPVPADTGPADAASPADAQGPDALRKRSLTEAVPGLPSAADLDLTEPPAVSEPVHLDAQVAGSAAPHVPPDERAPRVDEAVKVIGPLRIEIDRFNRFLVEADELSRQLGVALGEWSVAGQGPVSAHVVAMAQALAVESAAVGHAELSDLCALLARALARSASSGRFEAIDADLFLKAQEEASRLLHTFAAGFLKPADVECLESLRAHAGEETQRAPLPPSVAPLARQADAARRRMAAALAALREQAVESPGMPADLEALDAVDREAQTLAALFEDLCARWPGAPDDPA